ncbi:MAG TPA: SpoIID/LytB domain-containing protein [Gemmatimonadaceae bacterium]
MPRSSAWTTHFAPLARRAALPAALLAAAACVSTVKRPPAPPRPAPSDTARPGAPSDTAAPPIENVPPPPERELEGERVVRIALSTTASHVTLTSTGDWRLYDSGGESTLLRADDHALWTIEARGGKLRAIGEDGDATPFRPAPFIARTVARGAFVAVNGKRYRGEVWVIPDGDRVMVVNRLYLEDYLRGVVPLEIGHRAPGEEAAVRAQAVAARSYAYTHLSPERRYDMVSTVMDQVYGGVNAETPISDDAVRATAGLVLTYDGRVVNAPYYSTCGGSTAAASEVWHEGDEPYLVPVSDRIPGTDHYYCDISPRFSWTRTFSAHALREVLDRYLRQYARVHGKIGTPREVKVDGRTASGRVRRLVITTDRGRYTLTGNDIRFVLRQASGEILQSTSFSVEAEHGRGGALTSLVLRGTGYGHGIGMCQWGAIGRARAGFDYRTILRTYYPGTVVAHVD